MADISTLTPSPPGLGDPRTSPTIPHPPNPPPHPTSPTDPLKQTPVPKSALYGDPSMMVPPLKARTGVRETPGESSPKTLLPESAGDSVAFPPADRSKAADEGRDGAEKGSREGAVAFSPSQPAELQGKPEAGDGKGPSPDLNPSPNLYPNVNVSQTPNPATEPLPPSPPPALAAISSQPPTDVTPAAGTATAEKAQNPQQPQDHNPHQPIPDQPQSPGSPRSEPCGPIPLVQEPAPSLVLPNPHYRPAPDTLSYLESASLMSGTLESLSGLGEDGSSVGSDSEVNGMVLRRTDKYGFLGGTQYSEGSEREIRVDVARQREMKWLEMFSNWDKWVSRRFQKVKLRCRKGIPSSLRARAWQLLSNSTELLESNPGKFEELEREQGDPKWLDIIEKDLHRQFPFHEMFAARGGHGQQDLFRILKAYTVYRPDEGYCQAQAPVAAVLLMHMPAEQAFWCLVQICEKYLPGYYSAGLEAIQLDGEIFFSLLRRVCPMAYRHLKKFKIDPILYMTEWFMCIFSRTLPWACVLRVWDMFFCEGVKVVFRVGLVLLKQMLGSVEKLRELQGMYETMERLRNIPHENVREDVLVQEVTSLAVSEALIERESSIQVRKWKESRGELTHQPGRRLHGTRALHELKQRSAAISSGGSYSFLGGPAPPPGPLRASSSLLSLPGFRKSKAPFRSPAKKGSFSGSSGFEPFQTQNFPGQSSAEMLTRKPSSSSVAGAQSQTQTQSPLVGSARGSAQGPIQNTVATPPQSGSVAPAQNPAPPQTLSPTPKIVSEQITPTIPSPTANNTPLPPSVGGGKGGAAAAAAGEEEGKKKKRSKEEKKKEKEEEKQRARERKEKDKAEKEKQKKDKEKKREKGGKKKEKGGGSEAEEKNGAMAPKDSA
ncbi:TBC1 domain family member 10B-like [Megalops cyprinoides]|uniref:TBC1 domain family member 10B-like n=1 Tax=Megalops cyprinoides TaxID=118141 RepID=UPI0018640FBA|nr:TBC1 domain family member 10B-like [Megalops cyprinoides]